MVLTLRGNVELLVKKASPMTARKTFNNALIGSSNLIVGHGR